MQQVILFVLGIPNAYIAGGSPSFYSLSGAVLLATAAGEYIVAPQ